MKRIMTAALALALTAGTGCREQPAAEGNAASSATAAAGSIDGTWVGDPASVKWEQAPDVWLLKDGKYSCSTCIPPITNFAADGAMHAIADRPTYDMMSVTQTDASSVRFVRQKAGKETGNNTLTVSADGKTLTNKFNTMNNASGKPTSGEASFTRVGSPVAGAHAISGQWQIKQIANFSPEELTATYALEGDVLNSTNGTGESFSAKLDGTETPVKGAADGAVVSVVRNGDGYTMTFKRGGKVVQEATITPSGNTLSIVSKDPRDNSTVTWTANRQ